MTKTETARHVDLILFDLDGTLNDSRKDIADDLNYTLKHIGLKEKSLSLISSYIGGGVQDLIRKSLGNEEDGLFDRAISVFEERYRQHATDNSRLYPNVKEVLDFFKSKNKVIVTNRNHEFAILVLKALGIYEYFLDIMGGDNLGCMKPSSCPLDNAASRFNVSKEKSIMVGDMLIDILAGKRAGMLTCAVTYGIGEKEDIINAEPDFIIDDIIKLKDIIH